MRFVNSIVVARGDFNGRVLSLRADDLRALCALVGAETIDEGVTILRTWGVLIGLPDSVADVSDEPRRFAGDLTSPSANGSSALQH